ncbi:MAG: metal-dependent phosphohydrolase [Microvirga sp.]
MLTIDALTANALSDHLAADFQDMFGSTEPRLAEVLRANARLAVECIANSDALYHTYEHTVLVTLAGRDIVRGRSLREAVSPSDWVHFLVACLMHDIGYVRGILAGDSEGAYVVDGTGRKVELDRGASDAALTPYHVDRSKMFVQSRFADHDDLDAERLARMIEFTRFPAPEGRNDRELDAETGLVRAADLIGQLGDPLYLHKANRLFHEFAEAGFNERLGYTSPADVIDRYPAFFWKSVSAQIAPAVRHLKVTADGRRWLAQLHANVFRAEHREDLDELER